MTVTTTHLIIALAVLNAMALLALLVAGRDGRRRKTRPSRTTAAPEPERDERPEPELPAEDPLHALVNEIEREESALRGRVSSEDRLAADIARWRKRATGGQPLPGAATSCRPDSRTPSRVHVA